MGFEETVNRVGQVVEVTGVVIIVVGAALATGLFLWEMRGGGPVDAAYVRLRRGVGRALLLGLEFLVAGDIIDTVAVDLNFHSLGVLAILVAIRTFLSLELELEIEGRWPWQRFQKPERVGSAGAARADGRPGD